MTTRPASPAPPVTLAKGWALGAGITPNVRALGAVSLLTDTSTEMAYPLLPLFLTRTLGAGTAFVGLVEGVAETTASLLKLISGWLSDRLWRRKALVADLAPAAARASAYGVYHTATGITALPASLLTVWLWQRFDAGIAFGTGAILAAAAAILLWALLRESGRST